MITPPVQTTAGPETQPFRNEQEKKKMIEFSNKI
jgi:hypothetical protein